MSVPPKPNDSEAVPPVIVPQGAAPPVVNPWVMQPTRADVLGIEYLSTRAMGWRAEIYSIQHAPFDLLISALTLAFWPLLAFVPARLIYKSSPIEILGIVLLCLIGSSIFTAVLFFVLFWSRYPKADSTRRLATLLRSDGIHGRNPQGSTFKPWKSLKKIYRSDTEIFLKYELTLKAYIAIEAFRDEASALRFMEVLRILKESNGDFSLISPELSAEFTMPTR